MINILRPRYDYWFYLIQIKFINLLIFFNTSYFYVHTSFNNVLTGFHRVSDTAIIYFSIYFKKMKFIIYSCLLSSLSSLDINNAKIKFFNENLKLTKTEFS